ncbi:MAG: hypothetical protein WA485_10865 [Candidatus Sulfotelmatobacter sp.]
MKLLLVKSDENYDYNIIVAQESSVSGAAAAVIALDAKAVRCLSLAIGALVGKGNVQRLSQGTYQEGSGPEKPLMRTAGS